MYLSRSAIGLIVVSSFVVFLNSCSKSESKLDEDPIASHFGQNLSIPDFNVGQSISTELVPTDNGLYIAVRSNNEEDDMVFRYNLVQDNILTGAWTQYRYNPTAGADYFDHISPLNPKAEGVSPLHLMIQPTYYAFEQPVYTTIDMETGTTVRTLDAPKHDFHPSDVNNYGVIIKDDGGQDWAVFRGGMVSNQNTHLVKLRYSNLPFNTVATFTANGPLYYSSSLTSANLYALSYTDKKLFIITPTGTVQSRDLSEFWDADLALYNYKNKFRSSVTGLYFQFQNKVIKLYNDGNPTLFYTLKMDMAGQDLGDFCVDNDYLFATDGTRKELTGMYDEVNIIPSAPSTSNEEVLQEYYNNLILFRTGKLETSNNATDKYIYILGIHGNLLIIPKKYY